MAVVGLPVLIWGLVWIFQGHNQKQQEAIAAGIREGMQIQALPPADGQARPQDVHNEPHKDFES